MHSAHTACCAAREVCPVLNREVGGRGGSAGDACVDEEGVEEPDRLSADENVGANVSEGDCVVAGPDELDPGKPTLAINDGDDSTRAGRCAGEMP